MWYEHRSRETGTLYFNTSLWLSCYQSPRIPHAPFLPHCHSVQSRQLTRHFQHSQVWLTKGPHGSRKLDSSLLCLSISTQGQNQGCWGCIGSTSRAEFRHNRGVCPEGSSQGKQTTETWIGSDFLTLSVKETFQQLALKVCSHIVPGRDRAEPRPRGEPPMHSWQLEMADIIVAEEWARLLVKVPVSHWSRRAVLWRQWGADP